MASHANGKTGRPLGVRLNKRQADTVRSQIQSTQILKRLHAHALNDPEYKVLPNGNLKLVTGMDPSQIKAAEILLRKSLPDLSSVEMVADVEVSQRSPVELEALAKHMKVPLSVLYGATRKA